MPIPGPNTNRKSDTNSSAINKKSKVAFHVISPCWISIFPTPQIKIPLLVAGPPVAIALLKGEAIGIDVGVGNDFVDEGHGRIALEWAAVRRLKHIIPTLSHSGKPLLIHQESIGAHRAV
jgi:hypothetical protein